jgi:hypothetical protein
VDLTLLSIDEQKLVPASTIRAFIPTEYRF